MLNAWRNLIWDAAAADTLLVTGVRKIASDVGFILPIQDLATRNIEVEDICYTKAKMSQLERNYWDMNKVQPAIDKLKDRAGSDHTSVSIQLQGREKDSRSQGFCMQNLVITNTKDRCFVDVYYRSTELIQKFLADLIFFSHKLPPVFEAAGVEPEFMRFRFANVYLSALFMPIFLRYETDPVGFFKHLKEHDPKFYRTCGLSTRRYFHATHSYTYRSRVKMFEYWKEHVDEKRVAPLEKILGKL